MPNTRKLIHLIILSNFFKILFAYETTPMKNYYIKDDHEKNIQYYNYEQKQKCLARFTNGIIFTNKKPLKKFKGIFIMDENGQFFVEPRKSHSRHSSFTAGAPVAAAGMLETDEHGFVTFINNKSGHYKPEEKFILQAAIELKKQQAAQKLRILDFSWPNQFINSTAGKRLANIFKEQAQLLPPYKTKLKNEIKVKTQIISSDFGTVTFKLGYPSTLVMPKIDNNCIQIKPIENFVTKILENSNLEYTLSFRPIVQQLILAINNPGKIPNYTD